MTPEEKCEQTAFELAKRMAEENGVSVEAFLNELVLRETLRISSSGGSEKVSISTSNGDGAGKTSKQDF
jgi:hypothetical protein